MKKVLTLFVICFSLLAVQGYSMKVDIPVETVVDYKCVDFESVLVPDVNNLIPFGEHSDYKSYRLKDSTIMFVEIDGTIYYDCSYFGDHDGSVSLCSMSLEEMGFAEQYMAEHFNHYGFVTYYDFDGERCTAVDETGEKYIVQFKEYYELER